jgi:lysozyme family protein
MAQFNEALHLTAINEGGYSNDIHDHGGETYAGIACNFWPNWQGWSHIDTIKENHGTDAETINHWAKQDVVLQSLKVAFYKQNFWDVNRLDEINDQQLADSVYDFGVNSGVSHAAKLLQKAVNIRQDGIIGSNTLFAANINSEDVYNHYNELRKEFYEILATHPGQHEFLESWLSRLKPYQTA